MPVTFYPNYIHNVGFDAAQEPSVMGQNGTRSDGTAFDPGDGGMFELVDSNRDILLTIDTDGEGTDFNIDLDLTLTLVSVDFAIIDKVNLGLATADMRIQFNSVSPSNEVYYTGSVGSDNMEVAEMVDTVFVDGSEIGSTQETILALFDGISSVGFEVLFRDNGGSNFGADVTIGEISTGKKFATDNLPEIGFIKSSDFGTAILKSKGGHKYGFKNYGEARRWALKWKYFTAAERTALEAVWAVTEGVRYPFYIDLGENTNPTLYYVRFAMNALVFTEVAKDVYALTIVIEEEV